MSFFTFTGMAVAVIAALALGVVDGVAWFRRPRRVAPSSNDTRSTDASPVLAPSDGSSSSEGAAPDRFAVWTPAILNFPAAVWRRTRVIHSLLQGDTVVVDCLIPVDLSDDGCRLTGIPFALRARCGAGLTPSVIADSVLHRWADTDCLVDLHLRGDGTRTLVTVEADDTQITLELERAH